MFFKRKPTAPAPEASPAAPTAGLSTTGVGTNKKGGFYGAWAKLTAGQRLVFSFIGLFVVAAAGATLFAPSKPTTVATKQPPGVTETNLVLPNRRDAALGGMEGLAQRLDSQERNMGAIQETLRSIKEHQVNAAGAGDSSQFMGEEVASQINALKAEVEALKSAAKKPVASPAPPSLNDPLNPPAPASEKKPPPEPKMRIVGEAAANTATTSEANLLESEVESLLAGGMFEGVLLNGMDAPTSSVTEKNPVPVLIRIKTDAILPNLYRAGVRECFVIAAGYGVLATERAQLRTETISCVRENGKALEAKFDAYVVGEDGKVGLRGRLVSKQGQVIAQSLMAGFLEGVGRAATPQAVPQLNINPGAATQTQSPDMAGMARAGAFGGLSQAASQISRFYLDMAQQMFPVVEIDAGRRISIVTLKGLQLGGAK